VLFLDELPEFDRKTLEALREPLESGEINISRVARQTRYLANFLLVATSNPCPCGYLGDASGRCRCTPEQVQRYRMRLSGPLLDRIDIQVQVPPVRYRALSRAQPGAAEEMSEAIRRRVVAARKRQCRRQGKTNNLLQGREIDRICEIDASGHRLLEQAMNRLGLSARAYHRILKSARTLADLGRQERIPPEPLSMAIKLRCIDQNAK